MKPQVSQNLTSISAYCPDCEVVTSFDKVTEQICTIREIVYRFHFQKCARCGRGGMARFEINLHEPSKGNLLDFFPPSVESARLPDGIPIEVLKEFREAELCVAFGAYRAASALFRSVLEKVLKANGYKDDVKELRRNLPEKIATATADGVITATLNMRAAENIKDLGNDVVHDAWREVTSEEVESSRHYSQRILEAFYDNREIVERTLTEKKRDFDK